MNEPDGGGPLERLSRQCTATSKRTGQRCRRAPAPGATVCWWHGGAAGQTKRAAERRVAEAEWGRTFGDPPPDANPVEVMADEIRWAAGHVAWLRDRVAVLDPDQVAGDDKAGALIELYGVERDRLARMCALAIRAGLAERLVRLEEAKGEAIARLIAAVVDDPEAGLSDEQRHHLRRQAGRRLRALAGNQTS